MELYGNLLIKKDVCYNDYSVSEKSKVQQNWMSALRNLYERSIVTSTSVAGKMSSGKIKQILYSVIEEIGRKNIQLNISSNITFSQKYIDIIMDRCITKITHESDICDHSRDIIIAVLCEALLHFMLTISSLPSERKVEIKDDLALDIVIPSLPSLRRDPNKSLVIQIIKDEKTDLTKVKKVEVLQPNFQNIWYISTRPLSITKYTEYSIFPDQRSHKYSHILTDIDKFLNATNVRSFRFIP